MSDTPETDAAYKYWPSENAELVDAALARKLERERDEAIRQRDETNRSSKYACDYNYEQKLKAERERDEAREALENHMASTVHSCSDECKRPMCVLRRQRDDAREMVKAICKNKFGTNCEFIDDDE